MKKIASNKNYLRKQASEMRDTLFGTFDKEEFDNFLKEELSYDLVRSSDPANTREEVFVKTLRPEDAKKMLRALEEDELNLEGELNLFRFYKNSNAKAIMEALRPLLIQTDSETKVDPRALKLYISLSKFYESLTNNIERNLSSEDWAEDYYHDSKMLLQHIIDNTGE
jgi:uncharacterized membrane protein YheB (UPF0754 family)|tara:strand:+ start:117 stop:620 length:504 start_codon:yes stop_codon:yes gene_type:complete